MKFTGLNQEFIAQLRAGGLDAYGMQAEQSMSDGGGNPCRCCLDEIPAGAAMLIAAARPFSSLGPYAETGPIFLCKDCAQYAGDGLAPVLAHRDAVLLKAYGADERILYGTGQITASEDIEAYCAKLFARDDVSFVDTRSQTNNCFLARITR